mmetsp:Transcript_5450/g.8048  ORF Transcript_5450/g.8048 Transcript_5450/m.8048 type:complete len:712 (+) Transcript_5450:57-2192(+)
MEEETTTPVETNQEIKEETISDSNANEEEKDELETKEETKEEEDEEEEESKPFYPPGSEPRRSPFLKGDELEACLYKETQTLDGTLDLACEKFSDKPAVGTRQILKMHKEETTLPNGSKKVMEFPEKGPIIYKTYKQLHQEIVQLGRGIKKELGLERGDCFGIYASTRAEWLITSHACYRHGIVIATCYANLGIDALEFVIKQTEMKAILVEPHNIKHLEEIADAIPTLKTLVHLDDLPKGLVSDRFDLVSYEEIVRLGQSNNNDDDTNRPKNDPDDTALIMYTSGSTGVPKGVMVAHRNLLAAASGVSGLIGAVPGEDVYLGYLPLAHILECAVENGVLAMGVQIGYGNPRTLIDRGVRNCPGDIQEIRPTIMVGVPRVWNIIRKGAMEKVAEANYISKALFKYAYNIQQRLLQTDRKQSNFWNSIVFKKFQKGLGGRMRIIVSGGAPLGEQVQEFLKIAFNCRVIQGYGLTETCGGGTVQDFDSYSTGNVGLPLLCSEIRLVDVPDMNYVSKNNQGEIAIRGANITKGYYKAPDKTAEVFIDGWFYTGDIGQWNEDGTLSIIDRKKNLVKTTNGEYVALEKLEMVYGNSEFVAPNGICCYADPLKKSVVANVFLNIPYFKRWAAQHHPGASITSLVKKSKVKRAVMETFHEEAKTAGLKSFEKIANVHLTTEEWCPENGLLTAAMKLKRGNINEKYENEIAAMYQELNE